MTERPILRFPRPADASRLRGSPFNPGRTETPGRRAQGLRFQPTFDRLAEALERSDPTFALREDPNGIAPERTVVFETFGSIRSFVKVASEAGFEVFAETALTETSGVPEGFGPAASGPLSQRTLYATMPTIDSLRRLRSLWEAHQKGSGAPHGAAPW